MPICIMPKLSPTMEEGTIANWHKKEGEFVSEGDVLFEVTTDKATLESTARESGYLRKIIKKEGESANVGETVAILTKEKDEPFEDVQTVAPKAAEKVEIKEIREEKFEEIATGHVRISPLARKMAKMKGIDPSKIQGTGPRGRIVSRDLESFQPSKEIAPGKTAYIEEPLTPMRKAIATRLRASKSAIPHYYLECQVLAGTLATFKKELADAGTRVSYNDIFICAVATALLNHPTLNSGFQEQPPAILRYKTIDISFVVDVEGGLLIPTLHSADKKTLFDISKEAKDLIDRARSGKLGPSEHGGGSFTISNLGMWGVERFVSVINPPQAAILAFGAIHEAPVVKNGTVVIDQVMNVALSVDHRIVDGTKAGMFLHEVKLLLEDPALLFVKKQSSAKT